MHMKIRTIKRLAAGTLFAALLSGCNIGATPVPTVDVGAIQTQAFSQVMTQAAAAFTPTPMPTNTPEPTPTLAAPPTFAPIGGDAAPTPFSFNTPIAGLTLPAVSPVPTQAGAVATITTKNGCNDGLMVNESAPYDGQVLEPGEFFQKNFDFVNTGSCKWDEGYVFVFLPGYSTEGFKGYDIPIKKVEDFVAPQKGITFSLKLNASMQPGTHIGAWKLRDDGGNYFGSMVYVKYVVLTRAERNATAAAQ